MAPIAAERATLDLVARFNEAFNRHDVDAVMALMTAAGDRCVARWIYRWVRDGKAGWIRGVDVCRGRDGRVAEKLSDVKG